MAIPLQMEARIAIAPILSRYDATISGFGD
jgi:hypothetical protein